VRGKETEDPASWRAHLGYGPVIRTHLVDGPVIRTHLGYGPVIRTHLVDGPVIRTSVRYVVLHTPEEVLKERVEGAR